MNKYVDQTNEAITIANIINNVTTYHLSGSVLNTMCTLLHLSFSQSCKVGFISIFFKCLYCTFIFFFTFLKLIDYF